MKLKKMPLKSVPTENPDVAELEHHLANAEAEFANTLEEVKRLREEVLLAKNYPAKDGSKVKCTLPIGRKQKEVEGILSLEWNDNYPYFKIYPYKEDGGLSSRGYIAPVDVADLLVEE